MDIICPLSGYYVDICLPNDTDTYALIYQPISRRNNLSPDHQFYIGGIPCALQFKWGP